MVYLLDEQGVVYKEAKLEFEKISKADSEENIRYLGLLIVEFFESLSNKNYDHFRNDNSDKLLFFFYHYLLGHYKKFQYEMTTQNKKDFLFNICKAVTFFDVQIRTGKSQKGILDHYTIENSNELEGSSLFRDLEFLQILTVNTNLLAKKISDIQGMIKDDEVSQIIIELLPILEEITDAELFNKIDIEETRKKFKDVEKYKNIHTISFYHRELHYCEIVLKKINFVIDFLENDKSLDKTNLYFLIFRIIIYFGEFVTQKNTSWATKNLCQEYFDDFNMIKNLANYLVKPINHKQICDLNNLSINIANILEDFKKLKSCLEKIKDYLGKMTNFNEKLEHYAKKEQKLNKTKYEEFAKKYFDWIEPENLKNILNNNKDKDLLKKIKEEAKRHDKKRFEEVMKDSKYFEDEKQLKTKSELQKSYKLEEIKKIFEFAKTETKAEALEQKGIIKTKIEEFKSFLKDHLPKFKKNIDENPIKIKCKISVENDLLKILFYPSNIGIYKLPIEEIEKIKNAVKEINLYNNRINDHSIQLDKKLLDIIGDSFINKFQGNLESKIMQLPSSKIIHQIAVLGEICRLYNFLLDDQNQLISEFYLLTIYKSIENPTENLIKYKQEFKKLRDHIRHHNYDNYTKAVEVREECVTANYIFKALSEDAFEANIIGEIEK